jgi:hypothetical protein
MGADSHGTIVTCADGQYKGEWYHLDICVDCLQYTANGTLPKCACEDNGGRN